MIERPTAFQEAVEKVRSGGTTADAAAHALFQLLTAEERLGLLDGDEDYEAGLLAMSDGYNLEPIVAGAVARLGIPGIRFTDGPRGVVMGHSTCFPVSIARGATWDVELEQEVGRAIGLEARAQGANLFAGVCINLLCNPRWGRAQETYGEDPVLLGELGAALTRGVRENVMACVKHFALNSIEDSRFFVDVGVPEDDLHEVYLAHFALVVGAGVDAVMSAYNKVNGEWAGHSKMLLTDILRGEWRFEGFVISDFIWGIRDGRLSLIAGLDVEMPFRQRRARQLPRALALGAIDEGVVRVAGARLIAAQLRHEASLKAAAPGPEVVAAPDHRELARRAAIEAMVMLRNEPVDGTAVLPLDPHKTRNIVVLGPLADAVTTGDVGSSAVRPPCTVTALAGIKSAFPDATVQTAGGSDLANAQALAKDADAAILVVGLTAEDEGEYIVHPTPAVDLMGDLAPYPLAEAFMPEFARLLRKAGLVQGGDRRSLTLHAEDEALVRIVGAANRRTVVVVIAGGPLVMESWRQSVPAVLMAWYPGMEGGRALGDVLGGAAEPGGRLPVAIPTDEAHLPNFPPHAPRVTYDRWWGQRKLDRDGNDAAYPLGFGLGYASFTLTGLQVDMPNSAELSGSVGDLSASVVARNSGDRPGGTVVQLYAVLEGPTSDERSSRQLLGFSRIALAAGEDARVDIRGSLRPLARRSPADRQWSVVPGRYRLEAAQYWGDPDAPCAWVRLGA